MELDQLNSAVATQKRVLDNMPVHKGELDKLATIRNLTEITDELTAEVRAAEQNRDRIEKQIAAREKQDAEMQAAAKELAEKLASQQESLAKAEQVGRRSVAFRPLEMSSSTEAILVLRYGKVYIFQNSAMSTSYNREDFFAIGTSDGLTSITPKPHRGVAITPESAATLTANLRRNYPPHAFHITIAVWDDSFGEFNPLCDALQNVGYRYRTIPCDDKAKLSFGSVASWVQ
jgi:plasmid stabilization system protein ParE